MNLFIKICGLKTATEVEAAVQAGADAVGFVLSPSPRQVGLDKARRLLCLLPAHISGVLVVRNLTEVNPNLLPPRAQVQGALPHGGLPSSALFPTLNDGDKLVQRARSLWERFGHHRPILIDGPQPGSGQRADWDRIAEVASLGPVCLAGGLTPENVSIAIERVCPMGVDVSSGVESRLGVKSPERIQSFIRSAREAAQSLGRIPCIQ